MFKFFQKKEQKDPVCGMTVNGNSISKHGEKFCSESCTQEYEKKHQIASRSDGSEKGGSCCP